MAVTDSDGGTVMERAAAQIGREGAAVVAVRTLFDGTRVSIHADGRVSDARCVWFGRIHGSRLWAVVGNICLYTANEVAAAIRAGGGWARAEAKPAKRREHHCFCMCGMCGGRSLSPGWIPAAARYVR